MLAPVPSYPLSNPRGYTGTHASPCGRLLGRRCHGDNRGKCLMKTLMRIYEAGAVCIYRNTTLSLSRAGSCGSTSISSLTQAVAYHRGVCSGMRPKYAASNTRVQLETRGIGFPIKLIQCDQKCIMFSFSINWKKSVSTNLLRGILRRAI